MQPSLTVVVHADAQCVFAPPLPRSSPFVPVTSLMVAETWRFSSQVSCWRCLRWPSRSTLPVVWVLLGLVCGSTRADPLSCGSWRLSARGCGHLCGAVNGELLASVLHSNLSQLLACSGSVSPADASSVTTDFSFFVLTVWCLYGCAADVAQIAERDFILVCRSKVEHSSLNPLHRELTCRVGPLSKFELCVQKADTTNGCCRLHEFCGFQSVSPPSGFLA